MGDKQAAAMLRHGQRVRLEDSTGVIYVSEVASVESTSLVLRLLDDAPEDAFPSGATAFIGIAGPSGLSRLKAIVDLRETDDPSVIDLTPLGEFEILQRRREPRVPVDFAVPCRRYRADGWTATKPLTAEDLSAGGLRAATKERFNTGDVVELELPIAASPVTVSGLVVTSRPGQTGAGTILHIAFTQLSGAARNAINGFVSTHAMSDA
jgi:hypothetical protein